MAYNENQAKTVPSWMIRNAKKRLGHLDAEMKQAKERIPSKYHDFLVLLPQNEKIGDGDYNIAGEANELGIYSFKKGMYMRIEKPYLTVDGRVKMLRDEHELANKKFHVHPPEIQLMGEFTLMSVRIESEIYGEATGMIEVGKGGYGADASNPFANAQTSAIGRALGFLGYGNIGTGVLDDDGDSDAPETPSNNTEPKQQTKPQQQPNTKSNKPQNYRILVTAPVQFNPDGSSTVTAKTEQQQIIQVVFRPAQGQFAKQLGPNVVMNVLGWLNAENTRLVVADNSPSMVENAG